MKKAIPSLLLFCMALLPVMLVAQGGEWTWIKGDTTLNNFPYYGTRGMPSISNTPGGFYEAANWIDKDGKFWIFGGLNRFFDLTSDMWKYDPLTNEWTWMNGPGVPNKYEVLGAIGMPSDSGNPGGRAWGIVTWTDNNGDLWLFGGLGITVSGFEADRNDLWKYNVATNMWTCVQNDATPVFGTMQFATDSNRAPFRHECTSGWVDANNNLWFFGGYCLARGVYPFGCRNDLWQYNTTTGQWSWMKGSQNIGDPGSYGSLGVESVSNVPPARGSYSHWMDAAGNFYIWGGGNFAGDDVFSDVWKYNPATNNWTWIAGDSAANAFHNYPAYCSQNGVTGPLPRSENRTAQSINCTNVFLTFGGDTNANTFTGSLNDLWVFNTQSTQWQLISGTGAMNGNGNYGQMGLPSSSNLPPSRSGHCMWIDNNGILWLYSGVQSGGTLDDFWTFTPDSACIGASLTGRLGYQLSNNNVCNGDSSFLTVYNGSNVQIYPSASVNWVDSTHAYLSPDSTTTYAITGNSICFNNDTVYFTLQVSHTGVMNYQLTDTSICAGVSDLLVLNGYTGLSVSPSSSITFQGPENILLRPDSTTTYLVTGTSVACNSHDTALVTVTVSHPPPITITPQDTAVCFGAQFISVLSGPVYDMVIYAATNTGYPIDSEHIRFFPQYPINVYIIVGNTPCGLFTDTVTAYVEGGAITSEPLAYTLSSPAICFGDTDTLYVPFIDSLKITPSTGVTWIDSEHIMLHPGSSITYFISAYVPCRHGRIGDSLHLDVFNPGHFVYTLYDSNLCAGETAELNLEQPGGVIDYINVQISPTTGVDLEYSIYGYPVIAEISPDSTVHYMVTAQSISCGSNDTAYFTITVQQPAPKSISTIDTTVCRGDTVLISVRGLTYGRSIIPLDSVIIIDTAHFKVFPAITTTYTIKGERSCGTYDSLKVTVHILSDSTQILPASSTVCPDDSTQLCAGTGLLHYAWSNNDTTSCIYATSAGNYHVTVTAAGGCTATATAVVNAGANDSTTITANHPIICSGDSTTICAQAGYASYLWNTGQTTQCITTTLAGNYYITATNSGSCPAFSNHITINTYPSLPVQLTISGDTIIAHNGVTFQWFFNSHILNGDTGRQLVATQPGTYVLQITDSNGCIEVSQPEVITDIENMLLNETIEVYPNPLNKGYWHVEINESLIGATCEILDAESRLVYKTVLRDTKSEITINAASGVYLMRISTQAGVAMKKLVKL